MSRLKVLQAVLFLYLLSVPSLARSLVQEDEESFEDKNYDDEEDEDIEDEVTPFSLEEVYSGRFSPKSFNGSWITGSKILYLTSGNRDIFTFDTDNLDKRLLVAGSVLKKYKFRATYLSPDESHLLISYSTVPGFRHSFFEKYIVYDIKSGSVESIADGEYIRIATWAPTGNGLVYVRDNDIYYRQFPDPSKNVRRITFDGEKGVVYNGVPDWVYEEEVLGTASALWFSPDGKYLAFSTLNDTEVKEASYFHYGEPGDLENQYPSLVNIKYPKPGTKIPTVSVNIIDLTDTKSTIINLRAPVDVVGMEHVMDDVKWLTNETIVVTWTNRVQNLGQIVSYDINGKGTYLLTLNETEGWLESPKPTYSNNHIFVLKYQDSGLPTGRFKHITKYQLKNNELVNETDLTPGMVTVISILDIDADAETIYYLASGYNEPSQRHFYSVAINGTDKPKCISCKLVTPEGNACLYVDVQFSKDTSHYVLSCTGPDPITVRIYNIRHNELYFWQGNELLRKRLAKRLQPLTKNLYIEVNGFNSTVRLLLPPNFKETEKYPMIVNVYGGPGTARNLDSNSYGFQSYITTNKSVIYATIDGRGSAYKGSAMQFAIYRALGTVEIEDQIAVAKILQDTYSWIDRNRTAIWGWSYGGFATAMALATDSESVFKCGISVAPVSSWIYYDAIYTESYMGLPTESDNLKGYNRSDVTRKVEGIRGKKFMLIHGTGDDNVHYQQALALSKALAKADIPYEQVTYTDEAHGLAGVQPHLYHTMDKFWRDCLNL